MRSGLLLSSMALVSTLMAAQWSPSPCFICASTRIACTPGLSGSSKESAFSKAASASATCPSYSATTAVVLTISKVILVMIMWHLMAGMALAFDSSALQLTVKQQTNTMKHCRLAS